MGNFVSADRTAPSSAAVVIVILALVVGVLESIQLSYLNQFDFGCPCCERDPNKHDDIVGALRNAENLGMVVMLLSVVGFLAAAASLAWRARHAKETQQPHPLLHWWGIFFCAILFAPATLAVGAQTQYARVLLDDSACDLQTARKKRMGDAMDVSATLQFVVGVLLTLLLLVSIAPTFGDLQR